MTSISLNIIDIPFRTRKTITTLTHHTSTGTFLTISSSIKIKKIIYTFSTSKMIITICTSCWARLTHSGSCTCLYVGKRWFWALVIETEIFEHEWSCWAHFSTDWTIPMNTSTHRNRCTNIAIHKITRYNIINTSISFKLILINTYHTKSRRWAYITFIWTTYKIAICSFIILWDWLTAAYVWVEEIKVWGAYCCAIAVCFIYIVAFWFAGEACTIIETFITAEYKKWT